MLAGVAPVAYDSFFKYYGDKRNNLLTFSASIHRRFWRIYAMKCIVYAEKHHSRGSTSQINVLE